MDELQGNQPDDKWGDNISDERKAVLEALFEQQRQWVESATEPRNLEQSAFKSHVLTGADVFFLAVFVVVGPGGNRVDAEVQFQDTDNPPRLDNLHLERANLSNAHLEEAYLRGAHLERAHLRGTHLERAFLSGTHLEQAFLSNAYLERTALGGVHMERAGLREAHLEGAFLSGAHLEGADFSEAHLEGADLSYAHLKRAILRGAHLEGAILRGARLEPDVFRRAQDVSSRVQTLSLKHPDPADLEQAILSDTYLEPADLKWAILSEARRPRVTRRRAHLVPGDLSYAYLPRGTGRRAHLVPANLIYAHLEEADLTEAYLEEADLTEAYLEEADLRRAHLKEADLRRAHLKEADLRGAHLEGAILRGAHLEGTFLSGAHLEGADLNRVTFDNQTSLTDFMMTDTPYWYSALWRRIRREPIHGPLRLADIRWNDADLTSTDWSGLRRLGDERSQRWWWRSRAESEQATRANTQLAKRLRDAGMNDDADRFAYRAQVCQRGVHLLRFRIVRWLFSWLLFVVAGYGYRPLRTLFWYLATIASFALAYYWTTRGVITFGPHPSEFQSLAWYEALVLSVSSFHGRGFLPFPNLGDPVTILAAIEAVVGLFIEISFIATFTQRFFGK